MTVTSPTLKVVEASLSVNVSVAVWDIRKFDALLAMAIDGAMVSGVLKFSVVVSLIPA